jgi:hypothetical protein
VKAVIEIDEQGRAAMLHDDAVNLAEFGVLMVSRASNVEFDNATGGWFVQSARTGVMLRTGFSTRAEALAWEKTHYSPGGAGWGELNLKEVA